MTQAAPSWSLQGEYFENCNCSISCPCTMDLSLMPSSEDGFCRVMMAFNVENGRYGSQDLSGLNFVLVATTPEAQPLGSGGIKAAIYVDERASQPQQEAISAIVSGQAGGLFGLLAPLMGEVLGTKAAPIAFLVEGKKRTVRIGGVSEAEGEALPSPLDENQGITINGMNLFNPGEPITQAKATSSTFNDFGIQWDNRGKNAYITKLSLSGP